MLDLVESKLSQHEAFRADVIAGLSQERKTLPSRWLYDQRASKPTLRDFVRAHDGTLRAIGAAVVAVVALVALSSAVLGPSSWLGWVRKAFVLTTGYHVNHVSLQSIVATDFETWEMAEGWNRSFPRLVIYVVAIVGFIYYFAVQKNKPFTPVTPPDEAEVFQAS